MTVVWGGLLLRFLSAAAAATVLEGFAAARTLLMDVDKVAPLSEQGDDVAVPTIALAWTWPTPYAAVKRQAYSNAQRRTVHWVEVHMGPITWQILDTVGYNAALELLREAHRTAVAVCLDGGKWRADPTKDDYKRPAVK